MIHNPESILFAWAQDEEEGAAISDQLALSILNQIRCAYLAGENAKILIKKYEVNGTSLLLSDATIHNSIQVSTEPKNVNKYIELDLSKAPEITVNENTALKSRIVFKTLNDSYLRIQLYDGDENKVSKLVSYLRPSEHDFNIQSGALINLITSDETSISDKKGYLNSISDCGLVKLNVENRKSLIKALAFENWVSKDEERIIIRLIETVPNQPHAEEILKFLEDANTGVLYELNESIDDNENRSTFYQSLIKLYVTAKGQEYISTKIREFEYELSQLAAEDITPAVCKSKNIFFWLNPNFLNQILSLNDKILYRNFEVLENGSVSFEMWDIFLVRGREIPVNLNPFELVRIDFKTSSTSLNTSEGETMYLPAICFSLLTREQWVQELKLAVNAGLVIGGTGLIANSGKTAIIIKNLQQAAPNVYFRQFFTELLSQFASNTIKTGGDIKATVENLDFFNAGVKGLFGSKLKVFQEIAKSYLDITIEDGKVVIDPASFNDEEFYTELFYRQIFTHLPSPSGNSEKFAWDVLKKLTRSEVEDVTNKVIEQMKEEHEKVKNEK